MAGFDLSAEIAALAEGTEAHLVSDTKFGVMHDRAKIETPIPQLNCLLGGGIPLGIIVEAFGDPASGKSSTWYQTMGNFQRDYPNGVSIIVDTEASVDSQRMPFMGVDPRRVLRIPATSLEVGFEQVFKILDKKVSNEKTRDLPVFIIWDTISVGATEKQLEGGGVNSGGLQERPRVIKAELQMLAPRIEQQPIVVVLLNQVSTQMGTFKPTLESTGGWAIKHNAHLRLKYNGGKSETDGIYTVTKRSRLDVIKSKISPLMNGFTLAIDITRGGVIDPNWTMLDYAIEPLHYIENHSGWYDSVPLYERHPEYAEFFDDYLGEHRHRWKDYLEYMRGNPAFLYLMMLTFCEEISERYEYQAEVCRPYILTLKDRINNILGIETEVVQEDTEVDRITEPDGSEVIETKEEDTVKVERKGSGK